MRPNPRWRAGDWGLGSDTSAYSLVYMSKSNEIFEWIVVGVLFDLLKID